MRGTMVGAPDSIELLPPIEAHPGYRAFDARGPSRIFVQQPLQPQSSFGYLNSHGLPQQVTLAPAMGRRKIRLHLKEDVRGTRGKGFLGHFRQRSRSMFGQIEVEEERFVDRGRLTVSWYEGTASQELQEHVRKSTRRKLKLQDHIELVDMRFVDETQDPPEGNYLLPLTLLSLG